MKNKLRAVLEFMTDHIELIMSCVLIGCVIMFVSVVLIAVLHKEPPTVQGWLDVVCHKNGKMVYTERVKKFKLIATDNPEKDVYDTCVIRG